MQKKIPGNLDFSDPELPDSFFSRRMLVDESYLKSK
jgi:hypothetical protein